MCSISGVQRACSVSSALSKDYWPWVSECLMSHKVQIISNLKFRPIPVQCPVSRTVTNGLQPMQNINSTSTLPTETDVLVMLPGETAKSSESTSEHEKCNARNRDRARQKTQPGWIFRVQAKPLADYGGICRSYDLSHPVRVSSSGKRCPLSV